jgi:hypothetical protein
MVARWFSVDIGNSPLPRCSPKVVGSIPMGFDWFAFACLLTSGRCVLVEIHFGRHMGDMLDFFCNTHSTHTLYDRVQAKELWIMPYEASIYRCSNVVGIALVSFSSC